MCLYPIFIKNKRYTGYKIKKGDIACDDFRKLYVPVGCGKCYECKRQKAQAWRVRLHEEIKQNKYAYFVTLTFSDESIKKLCDKLHCEECNGMATHAMRLFLERWRKKHKKSLRHWFITELGHENTERIHLHGIIFSEEPITNEYLNTIWQYGKTDFGEYCNERTINYIVKYVTKVDVDHKAYEPIILCSAGIGNKFTESITAKRTYVYKPNKSAEYYLLPNGNKVSLPIYYRNKLYTQEERDKLWTERLDRNEIYVNGIKLPNLDTEQGRQTYYSVLRKQQEDNINLGYGDRSEEWRTKPYNAMVRTLNAHN